MLVRLFEAHPGEFAVSAVSIMEFAAGVERAKTEQQRSTRMDFLSDLRSTLRVFPFDEQMAVRAGLLSGELQSRGVMTGHLDLMIGVTALRAGYGVITRNVRHFQMIPGLDVVER